MCSAGPLWTWGGDQVQLEQQGSLWPPQPNIYDTRKVILSNCKVRVLPQSHLSEVSFLLACGALENWKAPCDCFVLVRREGWKKPPWLFVVYVAWGNVLSAVRPHSMLILEAYRQKFEAGGFVDPGRKSRFQTGAQEKNLLFHLYLLLLYWWMDAACPCRGFVLLIFWICINFISGQL